MKEYSREELVILTREIIAGKLSASIAHNAKNILMPITGYVELIESRVAPEKEREYFKRIESSGEALQSLLKIFLRLSSPSPERIEEEIDIMNLIREIISLFEHRLLMAKVGLERDIRARAVKVWGVYDNISLILASLLLNAIEATPPGGGIRLGMEAADTSIRISIDDDGPGVAQELREKIFEPFFTTKKGSLGLGLAVSLFLARDMSGDIALEGKNRFSVSLRQRR